MDASFKETPTVTSAAKVEKINIAGADFRKADGTTDSAPTNVKVLSVKIKDENGNVVKEVSNPTKAETAIAGDIEIASVFNDDVKLTGIAPGKYTAEISLDGYEPFTTEEFDLIDFHAATITTKATVKAIAKTTLSGSLRYEDGIAVDEDASIVIYDANGVVVAAKKYTGSTDAGIFDIIDGTNAKLGSGTYKVVVRGKGFETYVAGIKLKANNTTSLQIKVTKHIGGQVKLAVRDENNYGYGKNTGITLRDEYYVDPTNDTLDKYDYLDTVLGTMPGNYIGEFDATKISDVEYTTTDSGNDYLSKGNYTIWIEGTDRAYGNVGKDTVTVASANATAYKNIVLKSKSSTKTIPLTVTFTGVADQVDWVVIENLDGTIVAADDDIIDAVNGDDGEAGMVTFNVNTNATYVVKVYAKDKFVGSTQVTIQDFAKTTTVSLNNAERS